MPHWDLKRHRFLQTEDLVNLSISSMAKNSETSAMEIDDKKSINSDQIGPKFSING